LTSAWYSPPPDAHLEHVAAWLRLYMARVRDTGLTNAKRRTTMDATNPLYLPRNYLAQLAIDDAEQGDYTRVVELLEVVRQPYTARPDFDAYAERRPEWARHRPGCSMLSCSS
ncbi:MAG: hypothetical protein AAFS10_25835, partial [Myxococcota bacterium]